MKSEDCSFPPYENFCMECGRKNEEIVKDLFETGKYQFQKGRLVRIQDAEHRLVIYRNKTTEKLVTYINHEGKVTSEYPFCTNCGKLLGNEEVIYNHEEGCDFPESYKCADCGDEWHL